MARAFSIPGVSLLACAFLLSLLVSISLPFLPPIDVVRTNFQGQVNQGNVFLHQVRLGIWAPCAYAVDGTKICGHEGHGYKVTIFKANDLSKFAIIKPAWTRGLAVHPVAAGAILIALLLSFSNNMTMTFWALLTSFLAALLTLIAFAIDIALFALVRSALNDLNIGANTHTSSAFWMTFVSLILLIASGYLIIVARRRESGASSSYPMSKATGGFFSRLRQN
uniref:Pali-domain-containing protein n=1 Tax=Psilocybe cubensis TaxID=181762 RepID=A0A8H8CFS2_PSICU